MSERVKPPCVRGCTKPVRDSESGEKLGEQPKPATMGYLCGACSDKLHGWLLELPDLVTMLDPYVTKGDPYAPNRRGKISGSPALVRLEVEAMTDPRSVCGDRPEKPKRPGDWVPPAPVGFGGDVPGVLCQWADCLCDDLSIMTGDRESERPSTLVAAVELLTGAWWSNVVYRPWIDELYDEIHEIRGILRRLNSIHDPVPVGDCGCGQKLFLPEDGSAQIRCKRCGHRLDGMAVVRLKAAQVIAEAETG